MPQPLFVCHANCCRSVLAQYLYENLNPGTFALSAGVEIGDAINQNALLMLQQWGIDASNHEPCQITRSLCDQADAIFAMGPSDQGVLLVPRTGSGYSRRIERRGKEAGAGDGISGLAGVAMKKNGIREGTMPYRHLLKPTFFFSHLMPSSTNR